MYVALLYTFSAVLAIFCVCPQHLTSIQENTAKHSRRVQVVYYIAQVKIWFQARFSRNP